MYGQSGAKEDYNIMFDPSTMDTCHLHTLARDTRETRAGHVVPNYSHQLPHSATMGHGLATPHSYRLVRQHSNDGESVRSEIQHTYIDIKKGLTDRGFHHVAAGPGGRGWGVALSSPSSPVHSALQPAYSSPRVYGSAANIYAEVETDTEIDSGFTEESVSQEGDKSLYTAISQHGLHSAGQLSALGYTMDNQVRRQRNLYPKLKTFLLRERDLYQHQVTRSWGRARGQVRFRTPSWPRGMARSSPSAAACTPGPGTTTPGTRGGSRGRNITRSMCRSWGTNICWVKCSLEQFIFKDIIVKMNI